MPTTFGIVTHIVNVVFGLFTNWVGRGAAAVVSEVGKAMSATTQPILGAGFSVEYQAMSVVGLLMCCPIVIFAVIGAIIRQELGSLGRIILIRLPACIIFTAVAVNVVQLTLSATDGLCNYILQNTQNQNDSVFGVVTTLLLALSGVGKPILPFTGFAALLFAILAAIFSILLWLELALRSAAVAITTLFLPLALAGYTWTVTSHWAKRLAETIFALIISKLIIVAILDLATLTLSSMGSGGIAAGIEGLALLFLAALAPYVTLKLIPMFEQGATSHLEGMARRPLHAFDPQSFTRRMAAEGRDFLGQWSNKGGGDQPEDFIAGSSPGISPMGGGGSAVLYSIDKHINNNKEENKENYNEEIPEDPYQVGENGVYNGVRETEEQRILAERIYQEMIGGDNLDHLGSEQLSGEGVKKEVSMPESEQENGDS